MERLLDKIEYLRQEMHITALEKGISHLDVLMISQRVDEMVNEFQNMSLVKKLSDMTIGQDPN